MQTGPMHENAWEQTQKDMFGPVIQESEWMLPMGEVIGFEG